MDPNTQFDDLARRKLEELHTPFEEGHWLAAQQLLKNRKKGGAFGKRWALLALLLLMGGSTTWWALRDTPAPNAPDTMVRNTTSVQEQRTSDGPLPHERIVTNAMDPEAQEAATHHVANTVTAEQATTPDRTVPGGSMEHIVHTSGRQEAPATTTRLTRKTERSSDTSQAPSTKAIAATGMMAANNGEAESRATGSPMDGQAADRPEPTPHVVPPPAVLEEEFVQRVDRTDTPPMPPPAEAPATIEPAEQDTPVTTGPTALESASDTTGDDAAASLLDPVLPEAASTPPTWEIGVLAGPARSSSRYAGGNSADWQDGLSPERTAWSGAEVMRMGRHFGWGLGLHHGSYRERLDVRELSDTEVDISRFWFLTPVDTTVLVVGDPVVIDGETYLPGQSVVTTVDVLSSSFDTTTTTTLRRAARQSSNRVSYLEVPLLLDAHLVQGRWQMGLRGGPTIGLLTGRRGSLPNSSNDGYTDLGDEPFREVVFGWTARAYLRYRFNAGWSVGVEPMLRGQFGNALQQDDLSRRSSALGGVVSLSYRLK